MPADYAYRRYLIRFNPLNGLCWIEKNGAYICTATDRTSAIQIIDQLWGEATA